MLADTLAEFGLNVGEWAVLGSLLRAGAPYRRSPGAAREELRPDLGGDDEPPRPAREPRS